jgi:hypothetical protein
MLTGTLGCCLTCTHFLKNSFAKVSCVAPPQYNYYQLFESTGAALRYILAWTMEELQDAFAKIVKASLPPPSQQIDIINYL